MKYFYHTSIFYLVFSHLMIPVLPGGIPHEPLQHPTQSIAARSSQN
jgi:hypothetical protein